MSKACYGDLPLDTQSLVTHTGTSILLSDHFICLVEHEDTDHLRIENGGASGQHVEDCPWSTNEDMLLDLHTSFPVLGHSEECLDVGELRQLVDDLLDLSRQLS